uniref:DUF4351 domain-containing protein n=1 Tax=Candidatus Kentrum sp. TUN TaxID=2126343 RepID=A0A450ZL86_9GAMM|nr:MAG: protein of unknown function (DUF4351) [Candidatus Kentron sp. TUN]VFK57607.1 MAG: protein of unknown function (DUF4351) [Candidatus Kentron sp. TUN]
MYRKLTPCQPWREALTCSHGATEWKIPNEFLYLVDTEEVWRPYLLNFRFPILDLEKIPDRALSQNPRLYARLLVMKYATRDEQQMAIKDLLIGALKDAPEDLHPIVYYLVQTYTHYRKETIQEIIQKVRPEEIDTMMSQFAQDISSVARQEGMLEGEAKLLIRQLSRRFQPLPEEITERVYGADPNTIEIWADRVLDAKSLDDIFLE